MDGITNLVWLINIDSCSQQNLNGILQAMSTRMHDKRCVILTILGKNIKLLQKHAAIFGARIQSIKDQVVKKSGRKSRKEDNGGEEDTYI
jgi:hypothetical protein